MSEEINENELENVSGGVGNSQPLSSITGDGGSQPLMEGDENSSELNRPDHGQDHDDHHDHDADQQHGLHDHGI